MTGRSWSEKLADSKSHEVKPAPIDIAGMKKGELMLVPSAPIVDAFIRTIPAGTSMDVKTMRREMACRYEAQVTCPVTTGFHLRTVAEAACEALDRGTAIDDVTPFWRVLDHMTPTTRKLSRGPAFVMAQRAREGLAP